MLRSIGTPTFDSKRPIDSAIGSFEPRNTQVTSASRSKVNRHTQRTPRGQGLTTGSPSGNATDLDVLGARATVLAGFFILRLTIGSHP
jgi:hypothetical protein